MDAELRQKFLSPLTLRLVQLVLDIIRWPRIKTNSRHTVPPPFFIVGSGRSGTTLLRSVLQSHPDLHIPPETMGRLPNCIKKYYRYGGLAWDDLINIVVGEFSSFQTFHLWEIDLKELRDWLLETTQKEQNLSHLVSQIYSFHMRKHKSSAARWGDKSPFNTLRLYWIYKVFPEAQYIEIIRDGRDVVNSYLKAGLIANTEEAALRWKRSLEAAERFRRKLSPDKFSRIYYEDLVKKPFEITQKLCSFLDISYKEEMIKERQTDLPDRALAHMATVQKSISSRSIGKWKKELTDQEKEQVNNILAPLLKKHGYL